MTRHARSRALERFPEVASEDLVELITRAVRENRDDLVEYMGLTRDDMFLAYYRFRTCAGRNGIAVVNTAGPYVVTVMHEKMYLETRRGTIELT